MNLDMTDVLLGMLSNIPWWVYPIMIVGIYLKLKMDNFDFEQNIRRKQKIYDKIDDEKKEKYKPKNTVNTDRYKDIDKKRKGDEYEAYISKHFEKLGYRTVEHGKMHGVKDEGIDLMLKKGKEFIFIQCKDWDIKNKYRIDSKEIQYTRMNVRDYIENKQALFEMYEWKIFYVTSENILNQSAKHKIKVHSQEIEHQIIAMGI